MIPTVVPTYAALLACGYYVLSLLVIRARRRARARLGTGGDAGLERLIRVHANFAEYVPLALILLSFLEWQQQPRWVLHGLCLLLIVGRVSHAYGVAQLRENPRWRVLGMTATFFTLLIAAALLLVRAAL